MDDGDTIKTPDKLKVPFVVTPPLARIEANNSQTLRIFYIGEHQLPGDKESVFWLNILDIPPKPSADDQTKQYVQLAARSRFKLFYRPSELVGDAHDAPTKIQWRLIKQLGKNSLISYNPTPFYVSLNRVSLVRSDGRLIKVTPNMLAPHDTVTLSVDESINVGSNVKIRYEAIGDLGEIIKGEMPLIN
ncbi:fimbria/pilus periplasmic chaperone [Serratia sp. T13T92]|uniref:fimbria/pilus periplasmic chaperone n=1 Tax=Serratia sp. T13T92 TaxID=3397496 RepID=UPI0039E09E11